MRKTLMLGLLAVALGGGAAFALEKGDVLGTEAAAVRQALEAQGFEVRKIEGEGEGDDEGKAIEAYAMKDGQRYEIYVDRQTGAVQRMTQDD